MRHFVPLVFQIPPQDIAENKRAKIANVREIPNGRPADVHPHFAALKRLEFLDRARERIKKSQHIDRQKRDSNGACNPDPITRFFAKQKSNNILQRRKLLGPCLIYF